MMVVPIRDQRHRQIRINYPANCYTQLICMEVTGFSPWQIVGLEGGWLVGDRKTLHTEISLLIGRRSDTAQKWLCI